MLPSFAPPPSPSHPCNGNFKSSVRFQTLFAERPNTKTWCRNFPSARSPLPCRFCAAIMLSPGPSSYTGGWFESYTRFCCLLPHVSSRPTSRASSRLGWIEMMRNKWIWFVWQGHNWGHKLRWIINGTVLARSLCVYVCVWVCILLEGREKTEAEKGLMKQNLHSRTRNPTTVSGRVVSKGSRDDWIISAGAGER